MNADRRAEEDIETTRRRFMQAMGAGAAASVIVGAVRARADGQVPNPDTPTTTTEVPTGTSEVTTTTELPNTTTTSITEIPATTSTTEAPATTSTTGVPTTTTVPPASGTDGTMFAGRNTFLGATTLQAPTSETVPATIQAAADQTADLWQVVDASDLMMASVDASGVHTVRPSAADLTVKLGSMAGGPGGIKGIDIVRSALGGATGVNFLTGDRWDWGVGLDYATAPQGSNNSEFVVAYDGVAQADVLRIRSGPSLALANGAMPEPAARLKVASYGYADARDTLRELLRFEIGDENSPITHFIKTNVGGSPLGQFAVRTDGRVAINADDPKDSRLFVAVTDNGKDAIRLQQRAGDQTAWLTWAWGAGTVDWRMGRDVRNQLDFVVYCANGAVGSATSPGTEILRMTYNGILALGGLPGSSAKKGELELTQSGKGIILRSPNGTRYRVTVDNAGSLTTTPI